MCGSSTHPPGWQVSNDFICLDRNKMNPGEICENSGIDGVTDLWAGQSVSHSWVTNRENYSCSANCLQRGDNINSLGDECLNCALERCALDNECVGVQMMSNQQGFTAFFENNYPTFAEQLKNHRTKYSYAPLRGINTNNNKEKDGWTCWSKL